MDYEEQYRQNGGCELIMGLGLSKKWEPFQTMKALMTAAAKISSVFCALLLVLMFGCQSSYAASDDPLAAKKNISFKPDQNDLASLTKLLTVVNRFKEITLRDYEKALFMFATDEAVKKFKNFNENIWVETPPQVGWSLFMSASVHAVGGAKGNCPLVAFYYPWSDVFLITVWRLDEEIPKIIDAEMLMGDWIGRESPALSPIPSWLRTDMFKPAALGNSVAEAILAFERVFPIAPITDWRKKLLILENQQVLVEVNYPTVALTLLNSLKNIDDFRRASVENNPRMVSCRNLTIEAVRAAAHGHLDKVLVSADKTLPETKTVLKSLLPEWFRTLEAVAVITGKDGCLVFLAPVFDATGSINFFFEGPTQNLVLKRIDVIDYQGFYRNLKHQKGSAREGGDK